MLALLSFRPSTISSKNSIFRVGSAVNGRFCERFNWVCHAWRQMSNHYHLVVETPQANLSQKHARDEAIALAYLSGQHTMAAIAGHFGVHYTTVSRLVKDYEESQRNRM